MIEYRYLTIEEVIMINCMTIKQYSSNEIIGVASIDLLESAINRLKQSVFGQDAYNSIFEKAAALFESLSKNHPFFNANKRTAFISMIQFLRYNGYKFKMSNKKSIDFTCDVVLKKINFNQIYNIIKKYSEVEI